MKHTLLLHNPGAGEETHDEQELAAMLQQAGYDHHYHSIKERGWQKKLEDTSIIISAGGDGTVRRIVKSILKKKIQNPPPIGVLPLGTANNISKTINQSQDPHAIINGWQERRITPFDVGFVEGLGKRHFFIEAIGFGVFPTLVRVMNMVSAALPDDPDKQLQIALQLLEGIISNYKAKHCELEIDGKDYSGSYILAEIMNICSLGPNLVLAPSCDPGDGQFNIVLIKDEDRGQLINYISSKLSGNEQTQFFPGICGKHISFKTSVPKIHVDDTLVKNTGNTISIELDPGRLSFIA